MILRWSDMFSRVRRPTSSGTANLEARLARAMVRGTRRGAMRGAVVGLVAAGWIFLTLTGSYRDSPQESVGAKIADAAYNMFTFLSPRDAYSGIGRFDPLPPLLWWGRFFGVALSILTIFWAALFQFRWRIAALLIRSRAKGHLLVLSADGFADTLAREAATDGACIVLVENEVSSERMNALGQAGVVVIPVGASLSHGVRDGRAGDAASVICWVESDAASLSAAFAAREAIGRADAEILVRLDSPEMQRSLRSAHELLQTPEGRLRPISPTISSIRAAFSDTELVEASIERGLERVHVCLHGDTPTLGLIASFVLSHNWSLHLGSPTITWNTGMERGPWQNWAKGNYCFLDYADAAFGGVDVPRINAVEVIADPADDRFTAHIIDFGDDDRTLVATLDLAARLAQRCARPPLVKAVLRDSQAIGELLRQSQILAFSEPVFLGASLSFQALGDYVHKAAKTHDHHLISLQDAANPVSARAWHALGETYVHANHAASDHGSIKNFDAHHARFIDLPDTSLIEGLAKAEHSRWTVERLLDGWAPAAQRNNERRLHDKLIPWSALAQADRDREMELIRLELGEFGKTDASPRRGKVAASGITHPLAG